MGNLITYSFGMEQLQEVVRKAEARKTFEQHRQEYADALKKAGVTNTRFAHDPNWRNSLLSCQNVGDEWRDMVKGTAAPIVHYVSQLEQDLFWLRFDFAAWRAGLTWVDDNRWKQENPDSNAKAASGLPSASSSR